MKWPGQRAVTEPTEERRRLGPASLPPHPASTGTSRLGVFPVGAPENELEERLDYLHQIADHGDPGAAAARDAEFDELRRRGARTIHERLRERQRSAAWTDPAQRLAVLGDQLTDVELEIADVYEGYRHQSELGMLSGRRTAILSLMQYEQSRVTLAEAEANPAPPDPAEVRKYQAVVMWARALAAATTRRDEEAAAEALAAVVPESRGWKRELAEQEGASAETWLRGRGLPVPGDPIEEPTPA